MRKVVKVYEDPITRMRLEGKAWVVKVIDMNFDEDLIRALVLFPSPGERPVERNINKLDWTT